MTAKITKRFTFHGLRYTFTDLVRRTNVDAVVRRAFTGHVTEEMQRHYSNLGMDEKRPAIAGVIRLVQPEATVIRLVQPEAPTAGWDERWDHGRTEEGRRSEMTRKRSIMSGTEWSNFVGEPFLDGEWDQMWDQRYWGSPFRLAHRLNATRFPNVTSSGIPDSNRRPSAWECKIGSVLEPT